MSNGSIEIEAKLRLTDGQALRQRLADLGSTCEREFLEINTYFDSPDGAFKSTDQGLRVRIEIDQASDERRVVITHKGPRTHGKLKSRSETELDVADADAAARLLSVLGYREVMAFEKRRTRYVLDNVRVELDTLPHLGNFVEIEGDSEDAVLAVRDKLGLADVPLIRASYIAMLLSHCREFSISATRITFPQTAGATD